MGAIQARALEILDSMRGAVGRKQHARGKRIEFDMQPVRMRARDLQQTLARASALVARGGERRVADALEAPWVPADRRPVVRIAGATPQPAQRAKPWVPLAPNKRACGPDDRLHHLLVAKRLERERPFNTQPAVPAMARRIQAKVAQRAPHRPVIAS